MDFLTLVCIVGSWVEIGRSSHAAVGPTIWGTVSLTLWFTVAHLLLIRSRTLAVAAFIVLWIGLAFALLPTL